MTITLDARQFAALLTSKLLHRLTISNPNSATVQIEAGAQIGLDDGGGVITLAAPLVIDVTVSGLNGLDTGVEAADTWYYIYVIWDRATDTYGGLLSVSPTSPTLPVGYTYKRLVGAVRNDSSSDFVNFIQRERYVACQMQQIVPNAGTGNGVWKLITAPDLTDVVPVDVTELVFVLLYYDDNSTSAGGCGVAANATAGGGIETGVGTRYGGIYMTVSGHSSNVNKGWCSVQVSLGLDKNIYAYRGAGDVAQIWMSGYRLSI